MSKHSIREPATHSKPKDSAKDLGSCYCARDTLGLQGILRRCPGYLRRPIHITDTRPGVLMGRPRDPESHRKGNLRYHYNGAWAGPLDANSEPPITAEVITAYTPESVHAGGKPMTHRRPGFARQSVFEDSNAIKQSNMSFGETLKCLRLRSGRSRYRLAQYCGISEPYILRLESGERANPSRDVVLMLGLALQKGSEDMDIWDVDVLLLSAGYAPLRRRGDTAPASA